MRYALLGALLMVGGIATRIVAGRHHPIPASTPDPFAYTLPGSSSPASGWSTTAYDLVRIGGWALLIFGAVILVVAVVRELKR